VHCVLQGKLLKLLAKKVEFCYAPPSISPLYVSKTAAYSTGMQPGSASWNFFKTAQLAAPFSNNIASLFRGDTAVSGICCCVKLAHWDGNITSPLLGLPIGMLEHGVWLMLFISTDDAVRYHSVLPGPLECGHGSCALIWLYRAAASHSFPA